MERSECVSPNAAAADDVADGCSPRVTVPHATQPRPPPPFTQHTDLDVVEQALDGVVGAVLEAPLLEWLGDVGRHVHKLERPPRHIAVCVRVCAGNECCVVR